VSDDRIEVGVVGNICAAAVIGLADTAGSMNEHFIETATMWLVRFFVSQVPFPKDAGFVADGLQGLGQRDGVQRHSLAFKNGVSDPVSHRVSAGHQGRASRAAGR